MTKQVIPNPIPRSDHRRLILTRIRQWAITRILLEALAVVLTVALGSRALSWFVPPKTSSLHAGIAILRNLLVAALAIAVYSLMVRWLERRRATELDAGRRLWQLPAGAAAGVVMMALVFGILWLTSVATFGPGTGLDGLAIGLSKTLLAGVFEELLFRAIFFRIMEQACGTTIALIASAALFGLMHAANPGATLFSDIAIALEAGLLLGAAYAFSRNLWLVIGIHAGWNFAEGYLFGASVSGQTPTPSLIRAVLNGSMPLTGGVFGPEASVVSIAVCGIAALIFGIFAARRGVWRRKTFRLSLWDEPERRYAKDNH